MRWSTIVMGLAVVMLLPRAVLGADTSGERIFRLEVTERLRGEFQDWFDPAPGRQPEHGDEFIGHRLQVGVRARWRWLEAFVQYQQNVVADLDEDAVGLAGLYVANTRRATQVGNWLRQGWVKVAVPSGSATTTLQVGRMLFRDGAETTPKDPQLQWMKQQRIAERLIGPFDFTHVGRSFDGGVVAVDWPLVNLTGFGFVPTSGGFEIDGGRPIPGVNLAGVSATLKGTAPFERTDARLFWLYYRDDRPDGVPGLAVTDNRPVSVRTADRRGLTIHTIGAHAMHVHPLGPGAVDVLAWAAAQTGTWQGLDHDAWGYALEAGYRLPSCPGTPWLRTGIWRGSGDDDPADTTHGTFFQMIPTPRTYAQFPFYNLMNNQDVFAQVLVAPVAGVNVRTDYHWVSVVERHDLLYAGGGATKDEFFGYGGLVPGSGRSAAHVVDVGVQWQPKPVSWLKLAAYYAHAFGQSVVRDATNGRDADYGFVEATVTY